MEGSFADAYYPCLGKLITCSVIHVHYCTDTYPQLVNQRFSMLNNSFHAVSKSTTPDLLAVQFLIACNMQKRRGKPWYHFIM